MLQAKTSNGELLVLATLTKSEIARLKEEKQTFYCPVCNQPVMMKAGSQVIPHFAHHSNTKCPSNEGGEGMYHSQGKLLLYRWLKSQGLNVSLEPYLPQIHQRPDLMIHINGKWIAMEYQCARISKEEIHLRNEGYRKAGIFPIWLMGANRLSRQTAIHFRTEQMTLQLMHQFSPYAPVVIYYFCPYTLYLIQLHDVYVVHTSRSIAKIRTNRLNRLTFKDLFLPYSFSKQEIFSIWRNEKKHFRLKRREKAYGSELAWRKWLYEKHTHLEFLPSVIHLPISSQYRMKTPLWNWQSRICLHVIDPLPIGATFTLKTCERLLKQHLLPVSYFPLMKSEANPIQEYLSLLTELKVIQPISKTAFVKTNLLEFHTHVEAAAAKDQEVMDELIQLQTKRKHES